MNSTKRFINKVTLITGAGSGIGAATARAFASEGAAVAIMDVDHQYAIQVTEQINAEGNQALAIVGDVRVAKDCQRAVQEVVNALGGLDIAFCNAGVFAGGTVETQTEKEWDYQIDTLLKGTFLMCKYAIPVMRARGGGSIVLSGSNCSHAGCSGRFAYTAAKAAMPVLAKQLSNDYFHTAKIRTNCVSPGYVRSRMTENAWRKHTNAPADAPVPESMTKNWQTPEAIAATVLFLCSDDAADITGVTIPVSRTSLLRLAMPRMA